jgi:protein-disulfide isomerase
MTESEQNILKPEMEKTEEFSEVANRNRNDENNKRKNLIAALILVSGFFVGSLFVDLSQLIKGSGFSQKNLRQTDIFEADRKTWVAYNDPAVKLQVISDEKCQECDPTEALIWLRRVAPTISAEKINFDSEEGKNLIQKFSIKTLPAFIFSEDITKTDFYAEAQSIFKQKDSQFELNTQELGLTPGKYLETPSIKEGDAIFGNKEAKVKVVIFSDFQCPYCKALYKSMREIMGQYENRVVFVHKDFPLEFHQEANAAALASLCALEQGKFWEYGDRLFAEQTNWQGSAGTQKFKIYAQNLGLKTNQFNECLDSKKYQAKIDADKEEADSFGIAGTPAIFINDKFINGVVSTDDLKKSIDEKLAN